MASYQVPQFLDSGDKILGPLNLRQFGYVLVTFFICMIVFTITSSIIPELGGYAAIPAIPIALFGAYLSLGKYNGRDAEIYIVKWFTSLFKPKKMIYVREPYLDDLIKKENDWSYSKIEERWTKSIAEIKEDEKDIYYDFRQIQAEEKASMIKDLGGYIDDGLYNALSDIKRRELIVDSKQYAIKQQEFLTKNNQKQGNFAVNKNYSNNFYQPKTIQKEIKAENFFSKS